MDEAGGVQCFWGEMKKHPHCPHGPTLLFGRQVDGELEKFYACSACRDRKLCTFYLKHGSTLSKQQKAMWDVERKKSMPAYPHQKLYIRFNELLAVNSMQRSYCHNCEKLFLTSEKFKHKDHKVTENLIDHQLKNPTELLLPLENSKKEAQYLFSKKAVKEIVNMLSKLGAKQVLCIGAPRIHEYINQHCEETMSSLLLDLDGRFHNFFGPLSYCWYNLFNHHFFNGDAEDVFKDFMTLNSGKDTYVVCDPPFGGRVEPMSQTIKTIYDLHKKWNKLENSENELKILFTFPYYMEGLMKEKSNPPGIPGGLKDLRMSDYKVDYENHPLFVTGKEGKKQSSVVRVFTNVPLNLLELPESEYKYCKKCDRWTSMENKHCKKCKACTSKDGRRYRHCNLCQRCVKPTWKHCSKCERCALEKHKCGQKPKVTGCCFKCNKFGHIEKDCKESEDKKSVPLKKKRKRSIVNKNSVEESKEELLTKKMKTQNHSEEHVKEGVQSKGHLTPANVSSKILKYTATNGLTKQNNESVVSENEALEKNVKKTKRRKPAKGNESEKSSKESVGTKDHKTDNLHLEETHSVLHTASPNVNGTHKKPQKRKVKVESQISKKKRLQNVSLQKEKKSGNNVSERKKHGKLST